jgi:hypothetical protein
LLLLAERLFLPAKTRRRHTIICKDPSQPASSATDFTLSLPCVKSRQKLAKIFLWYLFCVIEIASFATALAAGAWEMAK